MRLLAPLGLLVLLTACESVSDTAGNLIGNPTDGLLDFIGDTVTFQGNPNRPQPESDNIRRVMGQPVEAEPLTSESGNIWPSLPRREPTAAALEKSPAPAGAAKPAAKPVAMSPAVQPAPQPPAPKAAPPAPTIPPATTIRSGASLATPSGNAILTTGANGVINYTLPNGSAGRAIDNGNGTMTLIGADGQVMSVPAPK